MSSKNSKKKKKKERIIYIDDGSTIADMSGVSGLKRNAARGSLKEQGQTFLQAMRMMFFPMLIAMGFITIAYLIVYLLL